MPSLPPAGEPFDVHEVSIHERGFTPEMVFLGNHQQYLDFAEECRADTIGCEFRVSRSGRTICWPEGGAA